MHLSRRTLVAAFGMLPAVSHLTVRGRETSDVLPLSVPDTSILSISPDGEIFVGRIGRDVLCFLSADSLTEISRTEPVPELNDIDGTSIAWSPDGQKIAFSLRAWELMINSDIYLAHVQDGSVTNLTHVESEPEGMNLLDNAHQSIVDVFPEWIDDTTLLFVRHQIPGESWQCTLCELATDTDELRVITDLTDHEIQFVSAQVHRVDKERLLFWATLANGKPAVVVAGRGGEVEVIDTDQVVPTGLISTDGVSLLIEDVPNAKVWQLPLDGDGSWIDVAALFKLTDEQQFLSMPTCGPKPGAIAAILGPEGYVLVLQDGELSNQGTLVDAPDSMMTRIIWGDDRLLVVSGNSSWMLDIVAI